MKIALYEIGVTVSEGGIQTSYWETAKRLANNGHEVHIYGGHGSLRREMPSNVKILTFPFVDRSRFPNLGSRCRKFAERLSFARNTLRPLLDGGYDVIYIRKSFEMPVALYVKRKTGAKIVYRSGGTEFYPGYRYFAKKLDGFLSCSEYNAGQLEHYVGKRPHVIYNGVDTDRFSPMNQRQDLRLKYGLSHNDIVLISISRIVGWKGLQVGIKALSLLGMNNVKYMIVGSGDYIEELKRISRELGVAGQIIFTGPIANANVPSYYSIADIALFPTVGDDDAFPNALCEAMACGKPAIGTRKGGIPEAIVDSVTGFLVNPDSSDAIAEKVLLLHDDVDKRRTVGLNARQRAMDYFSWDVIVKQIEACFYGVIEK